MGLWFSVRGCEYEYRQSMGSGVECVVQTSVRRKVSASAAVALPAVGLAASS